MRASTDYQHRNCVWARASKEVDPNTIRPSLLLKLVHTLEHSTADGVIPGLVPHKHTTAYRNLFEPS